jgi:hypothetical protein
MQRERDFQQAVIDLARFMGWRVFHARPALTRRGRWLTPIQGDAGFPDLVLCRPPRLILAELKRVGGKLSPAQRGWLDALHACAGVECYLWTPSDWEAIIDTLRDHHAKTLRDRPDRRGMDNPRTHPQTRPLRREN